jgi:hypothetical protein
MVEMRDHGPSSQALAPPRLRPVLVALLAAHLCLGAAHIAALPPWEGFDETGHFSSIQQIWDLGELPRSPQARLSGVIDAYRAVAPLPYASVAPFDRNGARTYTAFFAEAPGDLARGGAAAKGQPLVPRRFEPGIDQNPAAQHPPLFYALLSPLYGVTTRLPLAQQLLLLRLAAYAMAWLALVIGVIVAARYLPTANGSLAAVAAAMWPLMVPSWFPSMARLGNDALAALLLALLWLWIAARGTGRPASAIVTGLMLGAGALTKAFFLPIAAGTFAWWLAQAWHGPDRDRAASAGRVILAAAVMAAVAGWWYAGPSVVAVAAPEAVALRQLGGLVPALREHFSWSGWVAGHLAFLGMLAWSGTWSLARPPYALFVPLIVGLLLSAVSYLAAVRHGRKTSLSWLPAWWAAPVLIGFSYHMLVHVALTGSGRGVGGYYLHVLVAPLAGAMGLGAAVAWTHPRIRLLSNVLLAYALGFAFLVSIAQAWLFAGLLTKSAAKFYEIAGPLPAWFGLPEVMTRLSVLAFPRTALVLAVAGALLILRALIAAAHIVREPSTIDHGTVRKAVTL